MEKIKQFLIKIGVNKAILFFLLSKGFSFVATPLTLFLVATLLTQAEQGYYYTFTSLLGLSIFFELGLGIVVTQFASHEFANLSWSEDGSLAGNPQSLSRFLSILKKSLKWYGIITLLSIIFIIPFGLKMFAAKQSAGAINYILPWILLIIFFGVSTASIPVTAIIEGGGRVSHVQKMRFMQTICGIVFAWILLISGGKLFASPAEFFAYCSVFLGWFVYNYKGLIKQLYSYKIDPACQISWFREIFPMQWKIAVSWLAAYFMNYLFIPLLFIYRGPAEAGQMGMTLKIGGIVYLVSVAWINTRIPLYGMLIKKKDFAELDRLAIRSTIQAFFVGVVFSACLLAGLKVVANFTDKYSSRMLPLGIVATICISNIAGVITTSIAGYLRAHKQEPLMLVSIMMAAVSAASAYISAKYFTASVMAYSYAFVNVFLGIPMCVYVLKKKKKQWHEITDENDMALNDGN